MAQKPSIPKGTRDFPPAVMMRRNLIFDTIKAVFHRYGYAPIQTPAMENLDVLTGKYGEEGDRLIFKILNNGDFLKKAQHLDDPQKLSYEICDRALRYDLTVPFARFVVQHQHDLAFPFKRYQIQAVYRADRPQKGRYREFYQCDADVVGSDSLIYEAEFISIFDEVLSTLGLPGFSILLNNRKILQGYAEVVGYPDRMVSICMAIDKLDKIGVDGVKKELVNRGISEAAADQVFTLIGFEGDNHAKLAFLETQFADSEIGRQGVAEMREVLELSSYFESYRGTVDFNLELARGLDYYTGTIFEVKAHDVSIGSICGGGRYADLTGVFGMSGMSGVGISFGADRIYDVMNELELFPEEASISTQVLLINFGQETLPAALKALNALRSAGISSEIYPDSVKLKKQFAYANKKSIPYTLSIGEAEVASGAYQLKNMQTGEQVGLPVVAIIEQLTNKVTD